MEILLSRFRNLTVLLILVVAQLVLLAYQVKTADDLPLIRVWAVTAVTPVASALEAVRETTVGFFRDYFLLKQAQEENRRLKAEIGQLKLSNHHLKAELETIERTQSLAEFRSRTPSKTLLARVIMSGTGTDSKVVFLDRGSGSGVKKGMAVITPDGIVGRVINSYPTASQVLLVTDPSFAAGVVSQKGRVRGTLKGGPGRHTCIVDHVQNEEKVEVGEWFYTSGDDRVFPKGLPAGQVRSVREGKTLKEIVVAPSGLQSSLEEVLIVLEGVHQEIPQAPAPSEGDIYLLPPPPPDAGESDGSASGQPGANDSRLRTDADELLQRYQRIGEAQGHVYGKHGTRPPDFNIRPSAQTAPVPPQGSGSQTAPPRTGASPSALPGTPATDGRTGTSTQPAPVRRPAPPPTPSPAERKPGASPQPR